MSESTSVVGAEIEAAVEGLSGLGGHLMSAAGLSRLLGAEEADWRRYARHWDDLTPDRYMKDGGTYRHRRYGRFVLDTVTGELTPQPHGPYFQASAVNPLNGGVQRHFDPLTEEFRGDPLTLGVIQVLGQVFGRTERISRWSVELHPFRIVTSAEETGRPAPQGRHRDGSTYVTSLLVNRVNIEGGESSLYREDGERLLAHTMTSPGEQLLVDDRRLLHDVTPLRAVDPAAPAHRDVLIVDFQAAEEQR